MFGRISFGKVAAVAAAFLALGLAGGCGEKSNPSSKDDTYKLTTVSNPPAGGTIVALPPSGTGGTYTAGDTVFLTAIAEADYEFSSWTGAVGSGAGARVIMDGNKTVTANFTKKDDGGEDTTGGVGEKNGLVLGEGYAWVGYFEEEDCFEDEYGNEVCMDMEGYFGYVFKENGNVTVISYIEYEEAGLVGWFELYDYTYTVSGSTLSMTNPDPEFGGTFSGPFSISGDVLTLFDPEDPDDVVTLTKTGGITYIDIGNLGDGMFKSPAAKKLPKALGKALSLSARK
jgi:hypothetical protein